MFLIRGTGKPTEWGIKDCVLSIIIFVAVSVVVVISITALADNIAGDQGEINNDPLALAITLIGTIGVQIVLFSIVYFFTISKYKISWQDFGFQMPRRGGFWLPLVLVGLAYVVIFSYTGIMESIGPDYLRPDESTIPEKAFNANIALPFALLLAVLIAPISEEVFFRGFIFRAIESRWGVIIGATVSGLLFSLVHFNLGVFIPFCVIGMLFSFGYIYSKSLLTNITAHLLYNLIGALVSIFVI